MIEHIKFKCPSAPEAARMEDFYRPDRNGVALTPPAFAYANGNGHGYGYGGKSRVSDKNFHETRDSLITWHRTSCPALCSHDISFVKTLTMVDTFYVDSFVIPGFVESGRHLLYASLRNGNLEEFFFEKMEIFFTENFFFFKFFFENIGGKSCRPGLFLKILEFFRFYTVQMLILKMCFHRFFVLKKKLFVFGCFFSCDGENETVRSLLEWNEFVAVLCVFRDDF